MIASFPMYLRPENRAAHDAFWALTRDALRDHGIAAPDHLDHAAPIMETWGRRDLVLGQICNYPYRVGFSDTTTLIGAGDYGLPETAPGEYHSVFIARASDPRATVAAFDGARFAYNAPDSQSGWAAPALHARAMGMALRNLLQTGAHRDSARAVADGTADLAALDAVTWRMIAQWDGFADALKVIDRTPNSPGLSYITAGQTDPAPYRAALSQALTALPAPVKTVLGLRTIVAIPRDRYIALPIPEAPIQ
jgi:ABC-type phosphate/phosphonate transport system substrate-binding protein